MTFDKLVYRESGRPDPGRVLTVDFGGIGELTLSSGLRGETNWRRITRPVLDVLRAKLDACDFGAWHDEYAAPAAEDGFGWGLELFKSGKSVKRISGGAVPEQWAAFRSVLDLCGALAENRSKRETIPPHTAN